jgi:hypothetical protein
LIRKYVQVKFFTNDNQNMSKLARSFLAPKKSEITIKQDVLTSIVKCGYALVSADEFAISSNIEKSWNLLQEDWDVLPPDNYLRGGKQYRFRRYGRLSYLPSSDGVLPLSHATFVQSEKMNKLYGGLQRKFAEIRTETYRNFFLHELIKSNVSHFPINDIMTTHHWEIGVHQIRIVATINEPGEPTPEGVHRDGHNFVAMHLIRRQNGSGGLSTIYDNDKIPLQVVMLVTPLDSIFVEDGRVMHDVTTFHPQNKQRRGIRDMLVITYDYTPKINNGEKTH